MRSLLTILFLTISLGLNAQGNESAFQPGEWLRFRMYYGWLNASYATLQVKSANIDDKEAYHVVGKGKTTGFASIFFKVDDVYESYFDKKDGRPYRFIRKIDEGGYKKDVEINFDYKKDKAVLNDKKNKKKINFALQDNIQDLISAFYYLRNNYDPEDLVKGEAIKLKLLYDDDGIFDFQLRYLGNETIKTKYGKIECYKFRPIVQSGRVFKESESLTLWVSKDKNKIPIRIKANLAVGSIKADIDGYNGLKHQFKILMD
ncbi:MAG: ATP-dependent exonuclease [Maribacter sp.]|nr:MAG: ATP-dependent exonuclease [Maribacter sp.]